MAYRRMGRTLLFQSTLPQGERQAALVFLNQAGISIHAPARGATLAEINNLNGFDISIHAPARGATYVNTACFLLKQYFNPRSRKGSDRNYNQFSHSTFIQNYHFLLHCLPSFIPKLSFPRYLTILCAIFPVRIPHRFYVCFRFAPDYKISVWSAAVPRSTPICSTFVWYLFPR